MYLFGMLVLTYLNTRIQDFQANGGKIQDQKYGRDVIVIIHCMDWTKIWVGMTGLKNPFGDPL